jgi:histidinol dehydrogenase
MKDKQVREEFGRMLFSYREADFRKRLTQLREKIAQGAAFAPGDARYDELLKIVGEVENRGDAALAELTEKFDGVKLKPEEFKVSGEQMAEAHGKLDSKLLAALRKSIANVRKYQVAVLAGTTKKCGQGTGIRYTPIERVGVCVPGASAPLPSTVIMTVVPAQVAGVEEIAVISPPRFEGGIHPVILAVCHELGIEEVYRVGGAQGVAALAVGTKMIAKVDKIVGPGNQWVQTAKKHYFGRVDIDSIAGPSEVLIVANKKANPAWVAADMLSQAEHGPGSAVVFTDSSKLADDVLKELDRQVEKLSRRQETSKCLAELSGIAVFENIKQIIDAANDFASEHLQIQCGGASREIAKRITNAGAIFIGCYSPVAVGDYWAGPSHTLPTGMSAKFFSALSANDFVKSTSIIEYNKKRLEEDAANIIRLAETEGLDAHANSVRIRAKK